MKQLLTTIVLLLLAGMAMAQAPQGIPYQAVARSSSAAILANQAIRVRFTIHGNTASGAVVYQETFSPTTNSLGLFNVNIGMGTVVTGTFAGINWGVNTKFMQVEMDPAGGTAYVDMGTTQMMSVPYALYAGSAGNGFTHHIGEYFGGGVVFHLFKDIAGSEHGLIAGLKNLPVSGFLPTWGCYGVNVPGANSDWDGASNSASIVSSCGYNTAAGVCDTFSYEGFTDFYLPIRSELILLYNQRYSINRALQSISGADQISPGSANSWLTSSSQRGFNEFFQFDWGSGTVGYAAKNLGSEIRAIRSF